MPGDPREQLKEKYERLGWPAEKRPDLEPPDGWSIPLITSITRPRSHAPSPDGTQVAFFWDRDDASDLYVMPASGGWPARLTFDREPKPYWFDDPPRWSPDGEWLAFTNQGHVWVVPIGGGLPQKVSSFTEGAGSPHWMPDSGGLLVTVRRDKRSHVLLTNREGAWPRPVSLRSQDGHALDPQAAPNGRYVAYVHQWLSDLNRTDIMLADLETGEVRALTGTPARHDRSPRWSPDGRQIAYISDRPGFYEIFVYDLEAGQERQLTHAGHDLDDIAWSPDGGRILCTVNRGGAFDIGLVDTDSGDLHDVRTGYGFHARPRWLPGGHAITFEYEDPQTPPDLYRMDLDTGQVTRLTFSSPPALAMLNLVTPERVSYTSFDGLVIPAFLYRPPQPNGAAVLYPHGGPTSQYTLEWDIVAQYFIAKGYTWLAPNFRGSTGYGIEFTRANFGVWGVDDTQDCLAGADYLTSLDGIDRDRIAIFGASYGSYLTVTSLAYDPEHRFACGVAKYGDCNILTSWAQGEQGGREDLERMMGHPAQNRAAYRAGSPVWQVKNIEKPLLIVHGLLDEIVHPLQSEELVEALKREGKTFEYRTYPDEGHGILRRKNQIDWLERLERFLDWYLL